MIIFMTIILMAIAMMISLGGGVESFECRGVGGRGVTDGDSYHCNCAFLTPGEKLKS